MTDAASIAQRRQRLEIMLGSARRSRRALVAGAFLLVAMAWSAWWVFSAHERQQAIDAAGRQHANMIVATGHYIARALSNAGALASFLARARESQTPAGFTGTLVERAAANELFTEIMYCGADGHWTSSHAGTRADGLPASCSRWLAAAPAGRRAHVAPPVRSSRGDVVPLVYPVAASVDLPAGVLVLLVEVPRLLGLLQGYDISEETSVLVFGSDGTLRARWHSRTLTRDQRAPEAAQLEAALAHHGASGIHDVGGTPKIMTAKRLDPLPVTVLTATDLAQTLAPPRQRAFYMALAVAGFSLLVPIFTLVVLRSQGRMVQIGNELAEAQRQLRVMNAQLEDDVRARTAQLQRANDDLETFTYSVAHDVRAPIAAIKGFADVLAKTVDATGDAKAIHYLQRITANAAQMNELTEALLALGKLSRAPLVLAEVDLAAVSREIVEALRERDGGARSVQLDIRGPLRVRADRVLVRAVMENLLGNAWKFSARREHALIEVSATRDDASGEVTVCVRDNGEGFDASNTSRLFKPFQRMHSAAEFPGTGVGLVTVERIVARHGGRVWLESKPQEGTAVFLTLP